MLEIIKFAIGFVVFMSVYVLILFLPINTIDKMLHEDKEETRYDKVRIYLSIIAALTLILVVTSVFVMFASRIFH